MPSWLGRRTALQAAADAAAVYAYRFGGYRDALDRICAHGKDTDRDAGGTSMCDKFLLLDAREAFDENARAEWGEGP